MRNDLDERYMRLALRLALKGAGRTSPNPMVGAVLVRSGAVVATGYHRSAGADHAEIVALKKAGAKARGATLYINLEPCAHYGKTPPCVPSLVRAGIKRVIAGMIDPNPQVSGKGIKSLRRAGIEVRVGVLEEECRRLNEAFCKYITRGLPFVILKLAASLDGKIATSTGDSRWVTEAEAREYVHRLRNEVDAVLVGAGTVLADDPRLTCRIRGGRNPWRVVLDGSLRIPLSARLLRGRDPEKTVVVTAVDPAAKKFKAIRARGAQAWSFPRRQGGIAFLPVLRKLARMGILSVMIEGGAETASRALREGVVDKVLFFYAPKIVGGDGKDMIEALEVGTMKECSKIGDTEVRKIGNDILVSGYVR